MWGDHLLHRKLKVLDWCIIIILVISIALVVRLSFVVNAIL